MAIQIKVSQDKRKNGSGLYYGRAVHLNVIDTKALADRIQANCTVKKADVLAVLAELVEVMTYELGNSNKVLLDDFGYFYIGSNTTGAETKKDWNCTDNLKGFHVGFLPTGKRDKSGVTSRTFTAGLKGHKIEE